VQYIQPPVNKNLSQIDNRKKEEQVVSKVGGLTIILIVFKHLKGQSKGVRHLDHPYATPQTKTGNPGSQSKGKRGQGTRHTNKKGGDILKDTWSRKEAFPPLPWYKWGKYDILFQSRFYNASIKVDRGNQGKNK